MMRHTRSWAAVVLGVLVLVLSSCSRDTADPEPSPSNPSPLPASCRVVGQGGQCLDDIAATVQRDAAGYAEGETVTHAHFEEALRPYTQSLEGIKGFSSFENRGPAEDAEVEATSTKPIAIAWKVDPVSRTYWACFHGNEVTFSTATCRPGRTGTK